jgi:hypothetical protein
MKTTPGILFQQKIFKPPGKTGRELWPIPAQIPVFKYNPYLNLSNNWLFGGVGKYEQIKKLAFIVKSRPFCYISNINNNNLKL